MVAIVPIVLENAEGQYSVLINAEGQYSVLINAKAIPN